RDREPRRVRADSYPHVFRSVPMRTFHWHEGHFLRRHAKARSVGALAGEILEQRALMTVSVASIALITDTGSSGSDKITQTPTLIGSTSGSPPPYGWADIQFDHNGDGIVEGHSAVSSGSFSYNPIAADVALCYWEGNLDLQYR